MTFKKLHLLSILILCIFYSCSSSQKDDIHLKIDRNTNEIFEGLVKLRRDFHTYPELAGKEKRTSKIIANYLIDLGLEVKTNVAGNGVIGILKGGKEGKNIAWRADMDALPNNLPDDVPFKSQVDGVQHGCGHDIHMAIGLGIANVLSKNKESINGTIYFIFQPEEETFVGAKNMVNSTQFASMEIDEIYGLHITALPVGQVMVKPNELFAYQKHLQVNFNNSLSEEDAQSIYNDIRLGIQRLEDGANPWEIPLAFDAEIGLHNPETMFKDYLFMEENFSTEIKNKQRIIRGFIYESDKTNVPNVLPKIKKIIDQSAYRDKFISASYIQDNPTVINDESLTQKATTLLNVIKENKVVTSHGQIPYFNDDFFYFQEKIPGVYFLFGGSNADKGLSAMNHAPNFAVDEEAIRIGVKYFSSLILERANSN